MKIKKILISQPAPADLEKSPYRNLINKHNVDITFYKFFEVVGIPVSEFRKTRIHISEYSAIIFNSKNSIDHFFRMLKELRETVSEDMKYFCSTEAIALYLQNYLPVQRRETDRIHQGPRQGQIQIHQGTDVHLGPEGSHKIQP